MTTTIKITELTNIGANLVSSTVIPVVNMAGTPTTEKTVLGNIANVVLAGAGGNYVAATRATIANTVLTNAQPNITSVGTLTSLAVTGNITSGNATLGNLATANFFSGSGNNLSNIRGSNVSGFVPNANVANTAFSVAGSNVSGAVSLATFATIANAVAGANVAGAVGFATTANAVAAANVSGLGNIATINLTGSNSNVLYGNGAFAPISGGGANTGNIGFSNNIIYSNSGIIVNNSDLVSGQTAGLSIPVQGDGNAVSLYNSYGNVNLLAGNIGNSQPVKAWSFGADGNLTLPSNTFDIKYANGTQVSISGGANTGNVTFDNINIIGTGNLHLQPDPANVSSYLDIFISSGPDLHLVASAAANLVLGKDNQANVMTSWNGNVSIQSWNTNTGTQGGVWTFDGDGNLTLPNDANIAIYGNTTQFNTCPNGFLGLNSYDAGGNNIARVGISSADKLVGIGVSDPITEQDYNWTFTNGGGTIFPTLTVDLHNGGNQQAQTLQFGDSTKQAVITGPTPAAGDSAQRLIIQGQRANGTYAEGGDVYVWGGDSDYNGGDIKIYAGDSDGATGSGGYINLSGGDGADTGGYINLEGGYGSNGSGGYINITGGSGGNSIGGNIQIQGGQSSGTGINGANVLLQGGYSQSANGGAVTVRGGQSALGLSGYGNVLVEAGASAWTFDNSGNLQTPGNIVGPANANLTIFANAGVHEFIFADDGTFYAPDNVVLGGNSIYIGPGANTLAGTEHAVLIASSNHFAYIQGVINNVSDNGSADWVAQGHHGDDTGGWADMGFTSSGFGDANYTITGGGDGYVFAQSYGPGQTLLDGGGNLVLATGNQGTTKDIIFGTGGFLTSNIFGRISHSNNSLELSRTGASLKFPDGSVQTTAYTGGGGGSNTGNVTFNNQIVLGTGSNDGGGGLYLAPGNASIANSAVQYLRVRGGDYPTHIHLDTGNNEYYDQYFGADSKFVKLEANGNIVINADDYNGNFGTWVFDTDGNLSLPGDIIGTANANFTIYSNAAAHEFIFGDDGTFYAPDNVVLGGNAIYIGPGANTLTGIEHEVFIASSNNFAYVQAVVNNVSDNGSADWVALGARGDDTGGQASLGFTSSGFGDANYSITGNGDGYVFVQSYGPGQTLLGGGGNLVLTTGNQGTTKDIIFGTGGFLTSNIFGRISHSNNSLELSRTGATITFPDATEQNTAWTGSVTTIANGNSNVSVPTSSDNVYITTNNGTSKQWIFNKDGSLRTPGNIDIYGAINFPQQVSNINWSTYNIELSQYGRINTNVDFFANANVIGAQYLKGDGSNVTNISVTKIANGNSNVDIPTSNGNVVITTNGTASWTLDTTGNLTLPTNGQIIVSGGLVSSGASPAPTINGFSIINSVGISGNGNIAGNNISATGNVTAQGVGTNMVRRANTISGSNTVVTLDNLTALVGGTPTRLFIGAASSNMTMAGQSQTMISGSMAVSSWINVPIVTGVGNGFAMSGAISGAGDTVVLNITDQGAGSGTWRVTGMIANTSANLYSVSIERLA